MQTPFQDKTSVSPHVVGMREKKGRIQVGVAVVVVRERHERDLMLCEGSA